MKPGEISATVDELRGLGLYVPWLPYSRRIYMTMIGRIALTTRGYADGREKRLWGRLKAKLGMEP